MHFINTPDWACNYDRERDCNDDICVAGKAFYFSNFRIFELFRRNCEFFQAIGYDVGRNSEGGTHVLDSFCRRHSSGIIS